MGKSIDIKSLPQSYFRASESVLGNAGEPASPRLGLLGSGISSFRGRASVCCKDFFFSRDEVARPPFTLFTVL